MPRLRPAIAVLLALGALTAAWWRWWRPGDDALVVYCAHDAVFAQDVFSEFERRSGRRVVVLYDTEATKSLGLAERLIAEAGRPRCDVFWNNEALGTMDLAQRGLLAVHRGAGWSRIPDAFRDRDGRWTGFAARLRVVLVDTRHMAATPAAVRAALTGDLSQAVIAKPLYGTTLSHYAALWQTLGAARLQAWHRDAAQRQLRRVDGNAVVKDLVAGGGAAFGFTDTDDAFAAIAAGAAVAMVPATADLELVSDSGPTVVVPNTVAVIAGAPHPEAARQLADFLASAEVELLLARSAARQVPLGAVDEAALPEAVRALRPWAARGMPIADLLPARNACLAWLRVELGIATWPDPDVRRDRAVATAAGVAGTSGRSRADVDAVHAVAGR